MSFRAISQADVAAACGVSEMTVSRVMRGARGVSTEKVALVRQVARDLGYVPNRIAGALAGATVPMVAVVVPSLNNMVFPEVIMGLSEALAPAGLQPVLGLSGYDLHKEEAVLRDLLAWRPSAVVLTGMDHSLETRRMLKQSGLPVVEIMDCDGEGIDCVVGISHHAVGEQMAQAVIAAGYRNVVLLKSTQLADRRQDSRFAGFTAALNHACVTVLGALGYSGSSSVPKGHRLGIEALKRWPQADFLYCTNDMIAAGALFGLQAAGYQVPHDCGLAGFSGLELLHGIEPRIATTDTQRRAIGAEAGRMILSRFAGNTDSLRHECAASFQAGQTLWRGETPHASEGPTGV